MYFEYDFIGIHGEHAYNTVAKHVKTVVKSHNKAPDRPSKGDNKKKHELYGYLIDRKNSFVTFFICI